MGIFQHLDKNNLHHAYLIEGVEEEILPELFLFIKDLGVETSHNPDFYHFTYDSFKIDDAHSLKSIQYEKSFSDGKKIFLICANNFLLEAQNTLLKIFEEPIENTHFFIIVPNADILLKTLVSRFYLIKTKTEMINELKEAEKFITMPLKNRIDFIKELITEEDEEEEYLEALPPSGGKASKSDSPRARALKFLNALEVVMSKPAFDKNMSRGILDTETHFAHIFKVREFVNQPGSSLKNLLESVALIMPNF